MASEKAKAFVEGRKPYVVAEIGSTHLGDYERLCKITDECVAAQADAVKVQLFPDLLPYKKNNHFLPTDMFDKWLRKYKTKIHVGVTLFEDRMITEEQCEDIKFLKVARSQANDKYKYAHLQKLITRHPHLLLVGSFDYMGMFSKERFDFDVALYCHAVNGQTVYPVESELEYQLIMDNTRADGISDHSLYHGIDVGDMNTCIWLEKHVMLDGQARNSCGDAAFALEMVHFKHFVRTAKP